MGARNLPGKVKNNVVTTHPQRLLVIDDDEHMRSSLCESLRRRGFAVRACAGGAEGLSACQEEAFDVVLCDVQMPEVTGIEVCTRLVESGYRTPVVLITAFGSVATAVEAMRRGAFDYITKPFKGDELQVVIEKAVEHRRLLDENRSLRAENTLLKSAASGNADDQVFVGQSDQALRVVTLVERYADNSATVLIRGESGVGKEVVARIIHQKSSRKSRPFVCVNCAALSAGLLESELFGHEKGAFTGADSKRLGRFEVAAGGTILLDEVSEIDTSLQGKLLRVLQERCFERVGSSRQIRADVRVLATSNRELEREVRDGRFRDDLYFRLNVLPLEIAPLRRRKDDIQLLTSHFLDRIHRRSGGRSKRLSLEAQELLIQYDWPGNVRELNNVIERAWVLTDDDVISPEALPGIAERVAETAPVPTPERSEGNGVGSFCGIPLKQVERILIEDALRRYGGHQKSVASELGIGVRTLRSKIKKWNLGGYEGESCGAEALGEEEGFQVAARTGEATS